MTIPKQNKLQHPCFPQPSNLKTKVWRYIDTNKFIDILSNKRLYFSRLDLLGDTHEGSIPKNNYFKRNFELNQDINKNTDWVGEGIKRMYKMTYINCWYLDNYESEAMWRLYCQNNNGIAIQTTYEKLVESIGNDDFLYIGKVSYVDYNTNVIPDGNFFFPIMHKRIAFKHEKEVRMIKEETSLYKDTFNNIPTPLGIHIPWDLEENTENIYVNPYAPAWYYDIIKELLNKYECKVNLIWSEINEKPFF